MKKMMIAVSLMALVVAHGAEKKFQISVCTYGGEQVMNEAGVKLAKECGLTKITGMIKPQHKEVLKAAEKYGLEVTVQSVPRFVGRIDSEAERKRVPLEKYVQAVDDYQKNTKCKAMTGTFLCDEPSAISMDYLGDVSAYINGRCPEAPVYVNLYPIYALSGENAVKLAKSQLGARSYAEHVDIYSKKVPTEYICYDIYPYYDGVAQTKWTIANQLLPNYQIVSERCRKTGRDLSIVLQGNTRPKHKLAPSVNKLRYQAYSAMAYGAVEVKWACWTDGWNNGWHNNMTDKDGKPTSQYYNLKAVNLEMAKLASTYMRYRNTDTHLVSMGTMTNALIKKGLLCEDEFGNGFFRKMKTLDGSALVVGEMVKRDGSEGRAAFVLAANDPTDETGATHKIRFETLVGVPKILGSEGWIRADVVGERMYEFELRDNQCAIVELVTNSLQQEIDAVAAWGGGEVKVPSGVHEVKPILLRDGITLKLEKGAVLLASTNHSDYLVGDVTMPFVFADRAQDVTICGEGVFDGRGFAFKDVKGLLGESQPVASPLMMRFRRCRNVRLEDFTYRQAAAWGIHLCNSDVVVVRGVKARCHINESNDGIDIESSNVLIENCDLDNDDDALVFKSETDPDFVIENVTVRNCKLASCCNFIKFGTGSYGVWKNILIENCELYRSEKSWRFKWWKNTPGVTQKVTGLAGIALEVVDGGIMENVTVRNITWKEGVQTPIFARLDRRHEPKPGKETYFKNVLLENVKGTAESRIACSITGTPERKISGITLRNIDLMFPGGGTEQEANDKIPECIGEYPEARMFRGKALPAWGLYMRHAAGIKLENVNLKLKPGAKDMRQEIVKVDVDE